MNSTADRASGVKAAQYAGPPLSELLPAGNNTTGPTRFFSAKMSVTQHVSGCQAGFPLFSSGQKIEKKMRYQHVSCCYYYETLRYGNTCPCVNSAVSIQHHPPPLLMAFVSPLPPTVSFMVAWLLLYSLSFLQAWQLSEKNMVPVRQKVKETDAGFIDKTGVLWVRLLPAGCSGDQLQPYAVFRYHSTGGSPWVS